MLADFESRWGDKDDSIWAATGEHGMKRGVRGRHVGIHPVFLVAAALDPRFKRMVFPEQAGRGFRFDGNTKLRIESEIIRLLVAAKREMDVTAVDGTAGSGRATQVGGDSGGGGGGDDNDKDDDPWKDFNDSPDSEPISTEKDPVLECKQEWERFKSTKGIDPKDCPLEWWRIFKKEFPTVAHLARSFLAAQATSAPTERIFSRAERIISKFRTRLDPVVASDTHFVAENIDWFHAEMEQQLHQGTVNP